METGNIRVRKPKPGTTAEARMHEGQTFQPATVIAAPGTMAPAPRAVGWIQTEPSSIAFTTLAPESFAMNLKDIARSLSMQCRFGGHVKRGRFYSVAEHSVRVAWLLERSNLQAGMRLNDLAAIGLLHDADEAFGMPDLPSPVKNDPRMRFYRVAQGAIEKAVVRRFKLKMAPADCEPVKLADLVMLHAEKLALKSEPPKPWQPLPPVPGYLLAEAANFGWKPDYAEDMFLQAADRFGIK
jgi:hypothetical protein